MKKVLTILLISVFLATIPAAIQNQRRVREVKVELGEALSVAKKICDSGCTEYPPDWVVPGADAEAQLYCIRQCDNNMKALRDALLENFPILFTNQYNYRVAQLYCVVGLACPQLQITEYIRGY